MNLIDSIVSKAHAAGWSNAAVQRMALDSTIKTHTDLDAALRDASEVRVLCRLADLRSYPADELADAFVQARTPLPDVRCMLIDSLADEDEELHIDAAIPSDGAANVSGVWNERAQEGKK